MAKINLNKYDIKLIDVDNGKLYDEYYLHLKKYHPKSFIRKSASGNIHAIIFDYEFCNYCENLLDKFYDGKKLFNDKSNKFADKYWISPKSNLLHEINYDIIIHIIIVSKYLSHYYLKINDFEKYLPKIVKYWENKNDICYCFHEGIMIGESITTPVCRTSGNFCDYDAIQKYYKINKYENIKLLKENLNKYLDELKNKNKE
jgi:hypothetical protein